MQEDDQSSLDRAVTSFTHISLHNLSIHVLTVAAFKAGAEILLDAHESLGGHGWIIAYSAPRGVVLLLARSMIKRSSTMRSSGGEERSSKSAWCKRSSA